MLEDDVWYLILDRDYEQYPERHGPVDKVWKKRFYEELKEDPLADRALKEIMRRGSDQSLKPDTLREIVLNRVERAVNQENKHIEMPESWLEDVCRFDAEREREIQRSIAFLDPGDDPSPESFDAFPLLRHKIAVLDKARELPTEAREVSAGNRELLDIQSQPRDMESIVRLYAVICIATGRTAPYVWVERLLNVGLRALRSPEQLGGTRRDGSHVRKMVVRFRDRFPRSWSRIMRYALAEDITGAMRLRDLLGVDTDQITFPAKIILDLGPGSVASDEPTNESQITDKEDG